MWRIHRSGLSSVNGVSKNCKTPALSRSHRVCVNLRTDIPALYSSEYHTSRLNKERALETQNNIRNGSMRDSQVD